MVEISIAPESQRDALWTLFQEYCQELSAYDGEPRPLTCRHYPYFDLYWQDDTRFPFVILYDHEPVGFCLMQDIGTAYRIDEFYIRLCEKVIVLMLTGWESSEGVQAEIEIARALDKPVEFMEAEG